MTDADLIADVRHEAQLAHNAETARWCLRHAADALERLIRERDELATRVESLKLELPPVGSITFPPGCAEFGLAKELAAAKARIERLETVLRWIAERWIAEDCMTQFCDAVRRARAALEEKPE